MWSVLHVLHTNMNASHSVVLCTFNRLAEMQDQETPKTDPSSDDNADDGANGDISLTPCLSAEPTRSKSEQDLARACSLDLLMVCQYYYHYFVHYLYFILIVQIRLFGVNCIFVLEKASDSYCNNVISTFICNEVQRIRRRKLSRNRAYLSQ